MRIKNVVSGNLTSDQCEHWDVTDENQPIFNNMILTRSPTYSYIFWTLLFESLFYVIAIHCNFFISFRISSYSRFCRLNVDVIHSKKLLTFFSSLFIWNRTIVYRKKHWGTFTTKFMLTWLRIKYDHFVFLIIQIYIFAPVFVQWTSLFYHPAWLHNNNCTDVQSNRNRRRSLSRTDRNCDKLLSREGNLSPWNHRT